MKSTSTFGELLESSSALIRFDDHTETDAAEAATIGRRIAGGLLASGLKPGDRVALWLNNGSAYVHALSACAAGSLVAANVNTRYSPTEATTLMQRSGARVVITDRPGDIRSDIQIMTASDLAALQSHSPTTNVASASDPFLLFTTSGTTSKPKMVLHHQRSIAEHSLAVAPFMGLTPNTPMLISLPLCGVFGLNSLAAAVAGNSPIWLHSHFDAKTSAKTVEDQRIVAMNGSDDMFSRMIQTGHDLSSLGICGYGAFNASLENLPVDADRVNLTLSGVYGMSEVQALLAFRDPKGPLDSRRRAGGHFVSAESAVRVVDPVTGDRLQHESEGELQLQGPSLFAGYLAEGGAKIDPELTATAMVQTKETGAWFRTGDLGTTSADGSFTFISRLGDVLRLGGFLVAPAEIEEVVLARQEISDVQVVAVSGPSGSRPVAFVISAVEVDQAAVIEHCQASLAKFKCPVRVIQVNAFPVTDGPNGVKIQKSKLREMAKAALDE